LQNWWQRTDLAQFKAPDPQAYWKADVVWHGSQRWAVISANRTNTTWKYDIIKIGSKIIKVVDQEDIEAMANTGPNNPFNPKEGPNSPRTQLHLAPSLGIFQQFRVVSDDPSSNTVIVNAVLDACSFGPHGNIVSTVLLGELGISAVEGSTVYLKIEAVEQGLVERGLIRRENFKVSTRPGGHLILGCEFITSRWADNSFFPPNVAPKVAPRDPPKESPNPAEAPHPPLAPSSSTATNRSQHFRIFGKDSGRPAFRIAVLDDCSFGPGGNYVSTHLLRELTIDANPGDTVELSIEATQEGRVQFGLTYHEHFRVEDKRGTDLLLGDYFLNGRWNETQYYTLSGRPKKESKCFSPVPNQAASLYGSNVLTRIYAEDYTPAERAIQQERQRERDQVMARRASNVGAASNPPSVHSTAANSQWTSPGSTIASSTTQPSSTVTRP
jgi:hypothetical protein